VRIKVFPADSHACGFYRMRLPARVLAENGYDVQVCESETLSAEEDIRDNSLISVEDPECDIVVLQRPLHPHLYQAIPMWQKAGSAVVVELDDNFHRIVRKHPVWEYTRETIGNLERAIERADALTVSTRNLAQRYSKLLPYHARCTVLENRLDGEMVSKVRAEEIERERIVGWAGNPQSHPDDLREVGDGLHNALKANEDWSLVTYTGGNQALVELGCFEGTNRQYATFEDGDYFRALRGFGIGLAPLVLNTFNAGKSYLKPLEYAAMGVPCVASPTPEYKAARKLGMCLTAEYTTGWERKLRLFMEDDTVRLEHAQRAQEASDKLWIQDHIGGWLEAWVGSLEASVRRAA
jgi:hypothetical protein